MFGVQACIKRDASPTAEDALIVPKVDFRGFKAEQLWTDSKENNMLYRCISIGQNITVVYCWLFISVIQFKNGSQCIMQIHHAHIQTHSNISNVFIFVLMDSN